ncbi:MAG: PD40 domain-containing protein, partial [Pyrinomonadaceae bacterium]|nr:PD40 domain-containing protein [Pyrinomonadaceae bacterium]
MKILVSLLSLALLFSTSSGTRPIDAAFMPGNAPHVSDEKHLRNIRQLTFGGENAEAYFSPDGSQLIFQSKRDGRECDQIYMMRTDGSGVRMLSNGMGTTTCSYFLPKQK